LIIGGLGVTRGTAIFVSTGLLNTIGMLETGVQGADFEWVEAVEGFVVIFDVDVQ
jgi:hypothetical protein